MVIAVRAHCNPLDIYIYIYIYVTKMFVHPSVCSSVCQSVCLCIPPPQGGMPGEAGRVDRKGAMGRGHFCTFEEWVAGRVDQKEEGSGDFTDDMMECLGGHPFPKQIQVPQVVLEYISFACS